MLKTLKGSKSRKGRKSNEKLRRRKRAGDEHGPIPEETDWHDDASPDKDQDQNDDGSETEGETEGGSSHYQSSVWTQQSGQSRNRLPATDGEEESDVELGSPISPASASSQPLPLASAVQSLQVFQAAHKVAHKAKRKVVDMIAAPGSPMRARMSMRDRMAHRHSQAVYSARNESDSAIARSKSLHVPGARETPASSDVNLARAAQQQRKGSGSSEDSAVLAGDADRAVYDSSHKQRVPSWCVERLNSSRRSLNPFPVQVRPHLVEIDGCPRRGGPGNGTRPTPAHIQSRRPVLLQTGTTQKGLDRVVDLLVQR